MANNRVEYVLGFKADTSSASKAISDLNAQLNKLQNLSSENLHISGDIKEAADAAKILQQNLQAATNVKTGQVNVAQFAKNLKAAGTSVTELGQKLINAGATGTQAFAQLGQSIAAMQVPLKQTSALLNNMMTTLKNTVKWEISSSFVHGIESTFSSAINYAKDLNASLTDIRIVSGQSVDQMVKFAKEANVAAKALGTTTKAYADASLIYYQQGDSATLAAKKAEITLKATNAAFKATASEMSEMLTATWNAYRAGSGELEKYVDVMANLGAHTATSMEEIATALQKVAATANNVGVGMQQMSAMIATVSSTTRQSAESIGTSMNTILSRIGGLKLGQTLEDGVDLNKYSKGLQSVGVNVLDATGNLRDMGVVIDELGQKWETLSRAQQAATAQLIGGARNYTSMMALFGNWDKYQENLGLANNSAGALQKMQETYLTGWEGASKRLKASMEGVWNSLIDDQKMIKFTNTLASIVDQANNLIQSFGGLPGILTQVGSIAVQVFSKNIAGGITQAIDKIKTFGGSFRNLGLVDDKKSFSELGFKDKIRYSAQAMSMTTNERLYKQVAGQTYDLLKDTRGQNADNPALSAQINSSQVLIEKKLELQSIESQLSDTQKAQYQAALAGLSAQAEEIKVVSAEYREQQNILDEQTRTIRSNKELQEATGRAQSLAIKELAGKSPKEIREGFNETASYLMDRDNSNLTGGFLKGFDLDKLLASGNALDQLIERFEHLTRIDTELSRLSVSAGNSLTEAIQRPKEKLPDFITQLEQARENIRKIGGDDAANKFDPIIESLKKVKDGTEEDIVQALQNAKAELDSFGNEVSMSIGTATDILANRLGISREKLDELAESAGLTEVQLIKLAQAANGFENGAKTLEMKVSSLQKHLSNITSAAGAMAGAFSSAYNVWANWDTANIASKITGTVSAITQGINATMQGAKMGSAFGPWGTLIGGAIGLGSSIVGLISGQKEYSQKQLEQDYEDKSKQYEKIKSNNEEKQSLTELIKEYNQLYAQYKNGENVQDQLKISAEKLIEAYDLQQGKIRVLSGDYEGFNSILRNTIDLQEEINQNTQIGQAAESTLRAGVKKDNKTSAEDFTNYQSNNVQSTTDTTWTSARLMTLGINLGELQEYDQSLFLSILYNELVNNLQDSFRNYFNGFDGNDVQFEFSRNKSGQISINTNRFDDIFQTIINLFGEDVYNELMNNIANNNGISGDIIGKTFSESKFASELNKQIQQYINNNGESFYNILQSLIGADDTTIESVGNFLETIFNFISSDQLEDFTSQLNELIASVYENAPDDKNYANLASALSGFDSQITGQKDWTQRALSLGILTKNDEGIIEETDLTKLSGIDLANVIKGYQTLYQELSTAEAGIIEQKRAAAIKENETYDENQDSDIINLRNLKKGIAPFATEEYQQLADQVIASTLRRRQLEQMKGVAKQYSGKQLSYDDNVGNRVSISELYNTYSQNKQNVKNNQTDFQLTKASPEELEAAANKYAAESFEEVTAFGSIAEFFESFDNILDDGQMNELIAYMDSHKITDVESIQKYSQFVLAALQAGQSLEEAGGIFKTGSASVDKLEAATESQNKYETLSALEKSYKGAGKTDAAGYQALINGYQEAGIKFNIQEFEQKGEAYLAELTENARKEAKSAWQAVRDSSQLALDTIPEGEEGLRASIQANIDAANNWIDAYGLAGNQAEDTAKKINLLQSSFSSLPTSTEDMNDLLKLLNNLDGVNDLDAEKLIGMNQSDRQQLIINALKKEAESKTGTEKAILDNIIGNLQKQLDGSNLNEKLEEINNGLSETQKQASILNSLNITDMPTKGTKAFDALQKALEGTNKEFKNMSLSERANVLSDARIKNLEKQKSLYEEMAQAYANYNFDTMDETALQSWLKEDSGNMAIYQAYLKILEQIKNLDDQILNEDVKKLAELESALAQVHDSLEKETQRRINKAKDKENGASILSDKVQSGELSATDILNLGNAGLEKYISRFNNASTAIERAQVAMEAWMEATNDARDALIDMDAAYATAAEEVDNLRNVLEVTDASVFANNKNGFLDQFKNVNNEALSAINAAYDEVKARFGDSFSSLSDTQILSEVYKLLKETSNEYDNAFKEIEANGKDKLLSIYKEMSNQAKEEAEKQIQIWEDAFKRISDLKRALAREEDIGGTIFNSIDSFTQAMRDFGMTAQELINAYNKGELTPDQLTGPKAEDLVANYKERFKIDKLIDMNGIKRSLNDMAKEAGIELGKNGIETQQDYQKATRAFYAEAIADALRQSGKLKELMGRPENNGKTEAEVIESYLDQLFGFNEAGEDLTVSADQLQIAATMLQEAAALLSQTAQDYAEQKDLMAQADQKQAETERKVEEAQQGRDDLIRMSNLLRDIRFNGQDSDLIDMAEKAGLTTQLIDLVNSSIGGANIDDAGDLRQYFDNNQTGGSEILSALQQMIDDKIAQSYADENAARQENVDFLEQNGMTGTEQYKDAVTAQQESEKQMNSFQPKIEEMQEYAKAVGLTTEEFKKLKEEVSKNIDLNALGKDADDEMNELTAAIQRAKNGFKDLQKITDDTWDTLTDGSKEGTEQFTSGLSDVKNSMAKMFNVDAKKITDQFVKNHIKDMKAMAKGTQEEAMKAQDAIEDDLLAEVMKLEGLDDVQLNVKMDGKEEAVSALNYLRSALDEFDGQEAGFTVTADTSPAMEALIGALNEAMALGTMTAEQVQAVLNAIGWEPNIEWEEQEANTQAQATGSGSVSGSVTIDMGSAGSETGSISGSYEVNADTQDTNKIKIPKIKSLTKTSSPGGGARGGGSKGGGGGGGGGKQPEKRKPEFKKEKDSERYHQINRVLEKQKNLLSKIGTLKDSKYGGAYRDMLQAENRELQKQIKYGDQKLEQAKKYLEYDKNNLLKYGATFDAQGNLNYSEYEKLWFDKWNANESAWASFAIDDDAREEFQELFEDAMEAVKKYEDSENNIMEIEQQRLENINKMSENNLERITNDVEIHVKINQMDLDRYDYFIKKWQKSLSLQDESFDVIVNKIMKYKDNLDKITDPQNGSLKQLEDMHNAYLSGDYVNGVNDAKFAEGLENLEEQIMEFMNSILDAMEELEEVIPNAVDMATEQMDRFTGVIEHNIGVMENYLKILELTGQSKEYDKRAELLQSQYNQQLTEIAMLKNSLDMLTEQKKAYEEALALNPDNKVLEEGLKAIEETYQETEDNLLSMTQNALETAESLFTNTIDKIMDELDQFTGIAGERFSSLKEKYDWWVEDQELYVDYVTEAYRINKLDNEIEQSISKTRNRNQQLALKNLEDIIDRKQQDKRLTEANIRMMELEYELLLAQQDLENARDAKDTVRLTRDENGSYIYQYTANEDDVLEAEQKVNDVIYEMNQTREEELQRLSSMLFKYREEYENAIKETMTNDALTEEEKLQRIQELTDRYTPIMQSIADEIGYTSAELDRTLLLANEAYGKDLEDATDYYQGQINENIQAMIANVDEYVDKMRYETSEQGGFKVALATLAADTKTVTETAGINWQTMGDKIETVSKQAENASTEYQKVIDTLNDTLTPLQKQAEAWDTLNSKLQKALGYYEEIHTRVANVYSELNNTHADINSLPDVHIPATIYDDSSSSSENGGKNNSGGGGGGRKNGGIGNGSGKTSYVATVIDGKVYNSTDDVLALGKGPLAIKFGSTPQEASANADKAFQKAFNGQTRTQVNTQLQQFQKSVSLNTQDNLTKLMNLKNSPSYSPLYRHAFGGLADYTGPAWLDGTLKDPEYVLNAEQTEEMFGILNSKTVSNLIGTMRQATEAMLVGLGLTTPGSGLLRNNNSTEMAQNVYITAEFPDATDHEEIRMAFEGLTNRASQYVNNLLK